MLLHTLDTCMVVHLHQAQNNTVTDKQLYSTTLHRCDRLFVSLKYLETHDTAIIVCNVNISKHEIVVVAVVVRTSGSVYMGRQAP